jgi:hypothetical protein
MIDLGAASDPGTPVHHQRKIGDKVAHALEQG